MADHVEPQFADQRVCARQCLVGAEPQRTACHQQVVDDVHAAEDAGKLEHAHHAAMREPLRRQPLTGHVVEQDLAAVGLRQTAENIEQRGLAGAVGTDQPDQFSGRDVERHIIHGDEAAEPLADASHGQKCHARPRRFTAALANPHRPSRKKRAKMITSAANTTS